MLQLIYGKARLSTEKEKTCADSRVSEAKRQPIGTKSYEAPHAKRQKAYFGLIVSTMFPSQFRMTVADFRANLHPLHRLFVPFAVIAFKVSTSERPRIVIATPKRIDKRSSRRHASRRVIVEAIRPFLPQIRRNTDILITVTKCVTKQDRVNVAAQLKQMFEKAGIIET